MQATHDRLKPVVARAFSQPETIFDDHKDTKLEERVFNRRLEGGCGITKITTIAAVAHAARLLDVLPRTVKLPWQTTNETQVDDWRNSQSASLREAHARPPPLPSPLHRCWVNGRPCETRVDTTGYVGHCML